jgi:hypothetical protein
MILIYFSIGKQYTPVLARSHPHPIWPSALPLNLTYTLLIILQQFFNEQTQHRLLMFQVQNSHPFSMGRTFYRLCQSTRPCETFCNMLAFHGEKFLASSQTPQAGQLPLVDLATVAYSTYSQLPSIPQEAVTSVSKPRTSTMTSGPLNVDKSQALHKC